MKNLILITLATFALSACGMFGPARPGPEKIVYVDRAVPYCPAPPPMQKYEYLVDSLTAANVSTPGKVAKDYVYDMTLLRGQVKIYQMILDEYKKEHQDFSAVQAEIDKLQPPAK